MLFRSVRLSDRQVRDAGVVVAAADPDPVHALVVVRRRFGECPVGKNMDFGPGILAQQRAGDVAVLPANAAALVPREQVREIRFDGDPVEAAKGIRDFAKDNPDLVVKGGYMDGAILTPQDFAKFADLESREVLLAKLAGMMKAKQSQAASLFAAPLAQAARALGALQAKVEADPSASAAAAEAPAPEEVSATDQDADSEQGAKEEDANQEDANPHDSSPTPDAPEADAEPAAEAEETTEG